MGFCGDAVFEDLSLQRYTSYAQVRVLEVASKSPSQTAGLQPENDYLLGTAERVFKDPNILLEEVMAHLDQPMPVYVYNTKTDEVTLFCCDPVQYTAFSMVDWLGLSHKDSITAQDAMRGAQD